MHLPKGKRIYFASDFHFGIPDHAASVARERRVCRWLEEVSADAQIIYLVGDMFDTWFEYKNVVPKGFTRFLGTLANLTDKGIHIEAFTGNHDLWMRNYFHEELNIKVHHQPIERVFNDKHFFIGHGDGLGPGDHGYKMLKKVLRSPVSQWMYRRVHPDTGVGLAGWFSRKGPKHSAETEEHDPFLGPEKEWLVQFCLETLQVKYFDYFIFGHRHLALEYPLPQNSVYMNLGDWLRYDSYGMFDGENLHLKYYKPRG